MRHARAFRFRFLFVALGAMLCAAPASATVITYDFIDVYTGEPLGHEREPWISAVFDDGDTPGSVQLTLSDISLLSGEFVSQWLFNWDDGLGSDPGSVLSIVQTTSSPLAESIDVGLDAFKAGGGSRFDITIEFDTSSTGDRFGPGAAASFLITGAGITAQQFDVFSVGGGKGINPAAAHIQGIQLASGGDAGAWADPVPESSSIAAFVVGLVALGYLYRRSIQRQRNVG